MVISFLFLKMMCSSHERLPGHLEGVKRMLYLLGSFVKIQMASILLKLGLWGQAVQTLLRLEGGSSFSEVLK